MPHEDNHEFPPITTQAISGSAAGPSRAWPEFEGYKIVQELPRGGQAVVYKAIHISTKAKVALKVLLPGMLASARARRRFEQEVDLAASLNHPYIVSIRDSGIAQGQYYFAMEYISGKPFDRYVVSKSLPLRDIMTLFLKTCEAVAHAHQHGVIHRDLKPSNILVDERGNPHVLDFGLAKGAAQRSSGPDGISEPSMTGEIKGTLVYMSPEQAGGRPQLMDVRTDVYSLGIVLYRILTGEFPYDVTGTAVETVRHIESTEPKRPKEITRRFNREIEAMLLKCLAKTPSRRYHSAAELAEDIQRWLDGLPIIAKSVSSIYLLRKVIGRYRRAAAVLALLAVIMGASLGTVSYYRGVAEGEQRRAQNAGLQLQDTMLFVGKSLPQTMFLHFLDAWHRDKRTEMQAIARMMGTMRSAKESLGVSFLMDPNAWDSSQAALRQSLGEDLWWFADLVIGETYLKRGDQELAQEAFRRSYMATVAAPDYPVGEDGLLRSHLARRLANLDKGHADRASTKPEPMEEGQ